MPLDRGTEQVVHAHQARDAHAGRSLQHLGWRAGLQDAAVGKHRHPVAQQRGLIQVMSDQHDGHVQLLPQLRQFAVQVAPGQLIDGRKGFVQQQHGRFPRKGTRHGHALLLAARQLVRPALFETQQVHAGQQRAGQLKAAGSIPGHGLGDVLQRAQVRKQGVLLKHQPNPTLLRRAANTLSAVQPGLATAADPALGRAEQARDGAQHRGLAAAGGADERQQLARRAVQVHLQRNGLLLPQADPQREVDAGHRLRHGGGPA